MEELVRIGYAAKNETINVGVGYQTNTLVSKGMDPPSARFTDEEKSEAWKKVQEKLKVSFDTPKMHVDVLLEIDVNNSYKLHFGHFIDFRAEYNPISLSWNTRYVTSLYVYKHRGPGMFDGGDRDISIFEIWPPYLGSKKDYYKNGGNPLDADVLTKKLKEKIDQMSEPSGWKDVVEEFSQN